MPFPPPPAEKPVATYLRPSLSRSNIKGKIQNGDLPIVSHDQDALEIIPVGPGAPESRAVFVIDDEIAVALQDSVIAAAGGRVGVPGCSAGAVLVKDEVAVGLLGQDVLAAWGVDGLVLEEFLVDGEVFERHFWGWGFCLVGGLGWVLGVFAQRGYNGFWLLLI